MTSGRVWQTVATTTLMPARLKPTSVSVASTLENGCSIVWEREIAERAAALDLLDDIEAQRLESARMRR
jgi:hypothetical protein